MTYVSGESTLTGTQPASQSGGWDTSVSGIAASIDELDETATKWRTVEDPGGFIDGLRFDVVDSGNNIVIDRIEVDGVTMFSGSLGGGQTHTVNIEARACDEVRFRFFNDFPYEGGGDVARVQDLDIHRIALPEHSHSL